ncbi:hypothetical protein [Zoogloea sp. 1C4]|uniref:hypothetical protein n=1 Tax=Zoogloea sp. 1C4 TaxID=2570190 RepID=UPI001290CEC2|nr:hypothetical protein [Zoogloea sp. 1C4]
MNENHEVHKLVIRNMAVLEQAPPIVDEAEKRIFGAIDKKIEAWVKAQQGWDGVFDFLSDETSFRRVNWPVAEDGTYHVYLELAFMPVEGYIHYLSPLIGAVSQQFGFRFNVNAPWITKLENQKRAQPGKKWANFLGVHIDDFPGLRANGFRVEGEFLFHPVRLEAATLADAYPDTLGDALEPVGEALTHILAALADFDRLLAAADASFPRLTENAGQA